LTIFLLIISISWFAWRGCVLYVGMGSNLCLSAKQKVADNLLGETGWSTVCADSKKNSIMRSCVQDKRWPFAQLTWIMLQRMSRTSLIIGAGPWTGRITQKERKFTFGYSGWEFWTNSQVFLQAKIGLRTIYIPTEI